MDHKETPHPADIADQLERLSAGEASLRLHRLPRREAAAVLGEVEAESRQELVEAFSPRDLIEVVAVMPHDQAADLLAELPDEQRREVLRGLPLKSRKQITQLLRYPTDTAGGIMSDQFLTIEADQTVAAALQRLQGLAETPEANAITYLYVTDAQRRLLGVVPFRELVFSRPERRIREVMRADVKFVRVEDDQEQIANQFEHYHYLALPVLDADSRLVGLVSASQLIDVVQDEATEDMQLMVGLSGEERARTPWQKSLGGRFKWLSINLATAFLAGAVIELFEGTIARWTALAIFLPIVAGQGGNAGIQTLTVIIREMALGELGHHDGWKALGKEVTLGVLNGLFIGLIVGVVGYLWKGSLMLGGIVAIAMLLNMVAAALAGVLVPMTLRSLRIDPALASGILVTTVTDVAGFFFFLGLAALALRWLM